MAQQFKTLVGSAAELRPLLEKARALTELHRHVTAVVPHLMAQSCQVLSLSHGVLDIAVTNATIAAKLRQLAPNLVSLLQGRGCEVSGIRVKVQVAYPVATPQKNSRTLGPAAQQALSELSLTLQDSPLKLALQKMARARALKDGSPTD